MHKPLCFVLMPFGKKQNLAGSIIDFDSVYNDLFAPAINKAGLEPLRADEEMTGGIIHKPMYERLILCEYAIADLTTANANVFYELGIRHAVRPSSTLLLFAEGGGQLPFDVAPLRAVPYRLSAEGKPTDLINTKKLLIDLLNEARKAKTDSPLYQLVNDYPDIDHTKTDVFREQVEYSSELKRKLSVARKEGLETLRNLEKELGDIENFEASVVTDLFLSYRAVKGWKEMISLVDKMSKPLASTVMVQEQLALALNRELKSEEAEQVLLNLLDKRGPGSETYGILGRVYKDRWEQAEKSGEKILAKSILNKAIDAYLKGFEADWRDAYPGINAITLMEIKEPPDIRKEKIIPVVTYAVERRIEAGKPDYWDHATLLELAVLAINEDAASTALGDTLASIREVWEPETTARNLRLIREAREKRNDNIQWASEIEMELDKRARK
ncbi:MAG: TRAFs-binding domain-containing protein [Ignavibacteriaceae bacterium]